MGESPSHVSTAAAEEHRDRLRARKPVVVGADGSNESARGLLFAADIAATLGAELIVVHALGMTTPGVDWHVPTDERRAIVRQRLDDEWTAVLDRTAIESGTRTEVVDGPAAIGLLRVADDVDASLIVVGSHGVGKSTDPFLGSTSHYIVASSHRPVVVVPPGEDHPHQRSTAATEPGG